MASDIMSRNCCKVKTPCMIGQSEIKISGIHSEKKFKKLYYSLKFCNPEIALFQIILKIMAPDIMYRNSWKA